MSPLRDSFSHLSEPPSTVGSTQPSTSKRSPNAKKPKDDYEVGYGRPPEATRFKKGKRQPTRSSAQELWENG